MTSPTPSQTGTIPFDAATAKAGKPCHTWYEVYGDLKSGRTPVVAIHGGPGSTHHYLLSFTDLSTKYGIPVVFYDQLGNGGSTRLPEMSGDKGTFWDEQLFVDELDNLLRQLGIADDYALVGQSWGGMLASRHAVSQPKGLKRLVISNSPADIQMFVKVAYEQLVANLPGEVRDAILKHEEAGTTESQEYQDAMTVFYKKHLCRLNPWPPELLQSFSADPKQTVYHAMNGPSEFHITGAIKDWRIVEEAHKINVPTFLINGAYDEVDQSATLPFFKAIPKVKWFVFAESSHTPHFEEREKYMKMVAEFLTE